MNLKNKQTVSKINYYVNDINLDKETIIFVHAAFIDHYSFKEQISYFENKYNIILIDLLGHGSSRGFKTKDKITDTTKHITEILIEENIDKIHLVGVSIGGLLIQDFANKNPRLILSLTALGAYDINNYDQSIEKEQKKNQLGFMLKAIFSIPSFSKSNAEISTYTKKAQIEFIEMNKKFKRSSFRYMTSLEKIMNCNDNLPSYPLLIMVGEFDSDSALMLASKWHLERLTSKIIIINDAGHCANMDNPVSFNKALFDFISTL